MANIGRLLTYETPEELQKAIDSYFKSCKGKKFPTFAGLANHLDIDRNTLANYGKREKFFSTIDRARGKIKEHIENRLMLGNNVNGVIFLAKNYGYADKQEIDNTNYNIDLTEERKEQLNKLIEDDW